VNADGNGAVILSANENNDGDGSESIGSNEHTDNSLQ